MAEEFNKKGIIMVVTLLSIILGFIPSLVYWLISKNSLEAPLKKYLTNLLNFELTLLIVGIVVGVVFAPLTGLVSLINLIFLIIGTIKINQDQVYKFPMTIELIK